MALLIVDLDKHIGNPQAWRDTFGDTLPGLEDPQAKQRRRAERQPRTTRGDAQKSTRSRASVPSWDEILFGKGQPDK